MSARIAETVGFKALFMAVSVMSDAQLGLPGLGFSHGDRGDIFC